MDAYNIRVSINRDLQIPHAALTNSARVLISSVSIYSCSITARNTLSVTFMAGDRAGQVEPEILFLVFNSRERLWTACQCTSSLNIKVFPRNLLPQKGFKFVSKICVYFCKSVLLLLSGNWNFSTLYVMKPQMQRILVMESSFAYWYREPNFTGFSSTRSCACCDQTYLKSYQKISRIFFESLPESFA